MLSPKVDMSSCAPLKIRLIEISQMTYQGDQDRKGVDQPPFLDLLPGFFLERVATPRSKLIFCPRPCVVGVVPGRGLGAGVRLRSASVTILFPIVFSFWWCANFRPMKGSGHFLHLMLLYKGKTTYPSKPFLQPLSFDSKLDSQNLNSSH